MTNLLTAVTLAFVALVVIQILRIRLSLNFINTPPQDISFFHDRKLFLLIPVYREQTSVKACVQRFAELLHGRPWLMVVFITTEREHESLTEPSTHSLLRDLLRGRTGFRLLRSPNKTGFMAHQLNYAVRTLAGEEVDEFFLGVYNIDSDPPAGTLDYVYRRLCDDVDSVYQQHSIYPWPTHGGWEDAIIRHLALWQTRWSLHFEMGRLLCVRNRLLAKFANHQWARAVTPFHYTVGHGIFLSRSVWKKTSGFPEEEQNEDAFLGLILHVEGIAIRPVPFLEKAEIAPSIAVYVKQQAVWFAGPWRAWNYAAKCLFALPTAKLQIRQRVLSRAVCILLNSAKLFSHAIYWLAGPPVLLAVVPAALLAAGAWSLLAAWLLCVWIYCHGIHLLVAERLARRTDFRSIVIDGVAAFVAYGLHCIGPCLRLLGITARGEKYKTERWSDIRTDGDPPTLAWR